MKDLLKLSRNGDYYGCSQTTLSSTRILKVGKAILIGYVDDIIIIDDNHRELEQLKNYLAEEFELKDLYTLKYFLGMEVVRSRAGIVVSQRKHILNLL